MGPSHFPAGKQPVSRKGAPVALRPVL